MYFFEAGTFSELLLFENFFKSRYFLKTVTFSEKLVLRNQVHNIYAWKDFQLTSIHSFEYTMIWFDFELPQNFIVENSKKCIYFNTRCVRNVTF